MGQVNRLPRLELVTTRRQEQIVELCVMLKNWMRTGRAIVYNRMNIVSVGKGMVGHCRNGMGWGGKRGRGDGKRGRGDV